jgi:hypothetical protein
LQPVSWISPTFPPVSNSKGPRPPIYLPNK